MPTRPPRPVAVTAPLPSPLPSPPPATSPAPLPASPPVLCRSATDALLLEVTDLLDSSLTLFEQRRALARRLGAQHDPDTGLTRFGFWAPDIAESRIERHAVSLELFTPLEPIDFAATRLATTFQRTRIALEPIGHYWFGVLDGVRAGRADQAGALYWLRAVDADGVELIRRDLLAASLPWGSFAPAEVYDLPSLQRGRSDLAHFATPPTPPATILELHVPTATAGGTIGDLAALYRGIAARQRAGEPLAPEHLIYTGYDAIQPLPVDPTIERPAEVATFTVTDVVDELAGTVGVLLRQPENLNWGYDNIVQASSAVNPSLLGTRRPDELVALAEALHAMPEPIMLIYDLVYGHADNQAAEVLPNRAVSGPNMYGLDLAHQDPTVRALLLEMQRRRVDTGCDGLRIDGAQDFKFYNPATGEVEHDDRYLELMSEVEQEIGGHRRLPWMIFEDGRPWPAEGWEQDSTYRDVIERQPDVWQWGPLIFAHNTPMLEGFWRDKFWRVEQIAAHGGRWISGCANHDTVRRGTQVDPALPLNRHLGTTLPQILDAAYDNAAIAAASCALLPGIPMDFINASARAPWGFMRTTDDVYGPKVMAEERGFLDWQMTPERWAEPGVFTRSKRHGFVELAELRAFLERLHALVEETDYDLDEMIARLDCPPAMPVGKPGLHLLAADFMADMHAVCNVAPALPALDADHVAFMHAMRALRQRERWLGDDCTAPDRVEMRDAEQTVYHGERHSPDGSLRILTVANMAGPTLEIPMSELAQAPSGAPTAAERWLSPGARLDDGRLVLPDGAAIVLSGRSDTAARGASA